MENNIIDLPVICNVCKHEVLEGEIYKTDPKCGIIGECCSFKWGDISIYELEEEDK